MILQALNEHYWRLLEQNEPSIAPPGYSLADVSFVLVLSKDGTLLDVYPVEVEEIVPEHKKRSGVNPPPYFLCDKVLFSLGIGKDEKEGKKRFEQYRAHNLAILRDATGVEAQSVIKFLQSWNPMIWESVPCVAKYANEYSKPKTLNTVYKIEGMLEYVHNSPEIKSIWNLKNDEPLAGAVNGQCLITGEAGTIAKTHDVGISGIGEKANAAVVSFNCDAFESYGKSQSFNAPVSQKAAFAYATALNYLISNQTNRVRVADTTMVFWADKKGGRLEESILAWSLDPVSTEADDGDASRRIDQATAMQAKTILEQVKAGLPSGHAEIDPETRCYLLGLAPNAARLSVRFWEVNSFGALLSRIARHYQDMEIAGIERIGGFLSPWRILRAVSVQEDSKNIPPLLGGQLLKAILTGQLYPQALYNLALNRCRTGGDHGGVNTIRASVIKAFMKRKARMQGNVQGEELVSVSLNENHPGGAYQLGRLFSLLEKAQKDALGGQINATIRDRYFGAASATPGAVFPLLMRLSRHHVAKSDYGANMERKIQDVVNRLDAFPAHLNLDEQGQFILGYYHQNQANYQKNDNSAKETNEVKEG